MGRMDGKVVIITGAGTGVGQAVMQLFSAEGAKVFGVSRTQANLDKRSRWSRRAVARAQSWRQTFPLMPHARASSRQRWKNMAVLTAWSIRPA